MKPVAITGGAYLVELGSTSCQGGNAMHGELAQLRSEYGMSIAVREIDDGAETETKT